MSGEMLGNPWMYVFLVIFVGALVTIGIVASRQTKNEDDYAMARNAFPWYAVAFTMMASTASGLSFLGSAGMCYTFGWPTMWYLIGYPFAMWITISCYGNYGQRLNRMGVRSLSEYGGKRFNSEALRLLMAFCCLSLTFSLASQFTAVSTLLEIAFSLPYALGLIVAAALVMAYITLGGARADYMANTLQGAVMVVAAILCTVLFFIKIDEYGGFEQFARTMFDLNPAWSPAQLFTPSEVTTQYDSGFAISFVVLSHVGYAFMPFVSLRVAALDKIERMPKLLLFGSAIAMLCAVGSALPGLIGRLDIPDAPRADMINPLMFVKNFPEWMAAFLVIGVFAAIISTAAGMFLGMAQAIGNDLYRLFIAKKLKHTGDKLEKINKYVVRLSLLCIAAVCVLMVWVPPDFLTLFGWIGNGINVAILAPVLIGSLVYRKASRNGVLLATLLNLILYAIFYFKLSWTGMVASGTCVPIGVIMVVVFSKIFKDDITDEYLLECGFYSKKEYNRRRANIQETA
ncbi:MAG: sodium:solute symporter family protein [Gracilibacteraceae bacterium]|jgi:sodium/proline symporter|nr:sodium:solute symporter family protein [Gracilibacteraceae bacterium]